MWRSPQSRSAVVAFIRRPTIQAWNARWRGRSSRRWSRPSVTGVVKVWRWSRRPEGRTSMSSNHDSAGRPIVVVTGMGVVTSLGAGLTDNWKHLTAGKSGIKSISRFATDGMKTKFAGCVDFVPANPLSAPELSERMADMAAEEAVAQSGVGNRGDFPGPLFIAVP